jgi:predicted DNA-binding transcriptional regulator AlpA
MTLSKVVRRKKKPLSSEKSNRFNIEDLAQRWGVSIRTIERRIEDGVIPKPIMLGGRSWFRSTIEEFERTAHQ